MTQIKFTLKEQKPLEKWTSKDFLKYFSQKLKDLTNAPLHIPNEAWVGFGSRIKGFKNKLKLTNIEYKNFIDKVFSELFVKNHYEPAFGCIVSEKVFRLVEKKRDSNKFSNEDFKVLKQELYKDSSLFKQVELKLDD